METHVATQSKRGRFLMPSFSATFLVALFVAEGRRAQATPLQSLDDVDSIRTYRIHAVTRMGQSPPLQLVEMKGAFNKETKSHEYEVQLKEGDREPIRFEMRFVDGKRFRRMKEKWAEVPKFNLHEMSLVDPQRFSALSGLERVGMEAVNGRETIRFRGDQANLPGGAEGNDSIDFSRLDDARFDLWVDANERFLVKLEVNGSVTARGESLPVYVLYEHRE